MDRGYNEITMTKMIIRLGAEYFIAGILSTTIIILFIFGLIYWITMNYNCNYFYFSSQLDAQARFEKSLMDYGRDVYRLDMDKDGIACENLFKTSYETHAQ